MLKESPQQNRTGGRSSCIERNVPPHKRRNLACYIFPFIVVALKWKLYALIICENLKESTTVLALEMLPLTKKKNSSRGVAMEQ